ncbi:MAG: 4Fe-4S dicluster domain-containing protein [Candidatus Omnitrophica bacterium]|nr:4Fe-4S dicluster domain-containing protein [Candidatus Omnitrophota bacterium]MBU4487500.1 4Fe-4S dicluster domain-containing protein [Candidatus Omnitrophota bacterium]MCG2704912.1 4Fe-4S dicluster domain-containing protein [Candidatus Omnitrophota bacterium]
MKQKFLKKQDLKIFVEALAATYSVYYPKKNRQGNFHLVPFSEGVDGAALGGVRPFEPLKNFFFRCREKVVDGYEKSEKAPANSKRPYCVMGVKNCDLHGMRIQDFVFTEGDFKDPFYIKNREENLIIASDCTTAIPTCFCHALEVPHYPEKGYDILMSELSSGYLVEEGTDRGAKFLKRNDGIFNEAAEMHIEERDHIRRHAGEKVEANIAEHGIPRRTEFGDIIKVNLDSPIWETEVKACVECGSCNAVCPTCHCFYLSDSEENGNKEVRYKMWDACMYKRFAHVAGGANARPHLWMRLRNRFEKKFDFFPQVAGIYACTGCGRCYSGCPGKIDIRRVLKNLVAEKNGKKHE